MSQLAREVVHCQSSAVVDPQDVTRSAPGRALSGGSRHGDASHDVEALLPLVPGAAAPSFEEPPTDAAAAFSRRVRIGINASWVVNISLLVGKVFTFVLSGSYAVLASAVDSLVDVLSQGVLAAAEYQAARYHRRFPIGRTRMAEMSVLACACIMFIATSIVIRDSIGSLWEGFHGHPSPLNIDNALFIVLGSATFFKLLLYVYCRTLRKNPIMVALSEDHLNDVMSNVAAIAGAAIAGNLPRFWYADPAVAILFSLFIIRNWVLICVEQGQKIIGLEAPEELIQEVTELTQAHSPLMQLDRVTAYHHGSHMAVEVEVIMPAEMTVRESHDIALELQHKLEAIENVERAFVHVDYAERQVEEHKVERNLKLGEKDVMKPLVGLDSGPVSPSLAHTSGSSQGGGGGPEGARVPGFEVNGGAAAEERRRSSSGGSAAEGRRWSGAGGSEDGRRRSGAGGPDGGRGSGAAGVVS